MPINLGNNITGETSVYSQIKRDVVEGQLGAERGGFTPASLSGLKVWYDFADSASYTAPGGALSSINDKSGNNNTATGTGVIDSSGAVLPKPCVGGLLDLALTIPFVLTDYTVFVVTYTAAAGDVNARSWIIFNDNTNISSTGNGLILVKAPPDGQYSVQSGILSNGSYTQSVGIGTVNDGRHQLTMQLVSPNNANVYRKDGGVTSTLTYGVATTPTAITASRIGASGTNTIYTQNNNSRFGEIIAYSRNLTGTEITQVESYLKVKWGTP